VRLPVLTCFLAIAVVGCSVNELVATAEACPAALLSGRLAQDGMALVVTTEFGEQPVRWPEGYVVEQGPQLRLRDRSGAVVASEGDPIYVGGGSTEGDELFIACGHVSTDPP
jgi:hypothetical protein